MAYRIPFQERNTPWRGIIDLVSGCYPQFLFGGSTEKILPVFHFHDVTPGYLEPYLAYLAENKYQTVTSAAISAFVLNGTHPGANRIALTFDDAWLSLWTVVVPLLKKYGFTAIAYASPGRIPEAGNLRPTMLDHNWKAAEENREFVSWPELRAIHESGVIDVQAHTFSHSVIFCDNLITGFVTPEYNPHIHLRPLMNDMKPYTYVSESNLGCPLYTQRSRMSDALRYFEPPESRYRCQELVKREGGKAFFQRPDWNEVLKKTAWEGSGRFETTEEQRLPIREELAQGRVALSTRLAGHTVRHICFPFSICGKTAESLLKETGYETAFADKLFGFRAVKSGSNPYRLMRLKHQFIFCLPGKGRESFITAWQKSKTAGTTQ